MATSLRLDPETEQRYEALARETHRTKSFYMRQALEEAIDRLEYEYRILSIDEGIRAGRIRTYSLDEMDEILGLDD